ncbi:MAG: Hpt domain [Actinomycetota bacterium]
MASPIQTDQLDQAAVQALLDLGGDDLLRELVDLFMADLQPRLDELDRAITEGDNIGAANVAHALKGSCLYLGLSALADVSARMENSQRVNAQQDAHPLLAELHRCAESGAAALKELVA